VAKLAEKLQSQKNIDVKYSVIPQGNHFFTHSLANMSESIETYLKLRLEEMKQSRVL
jgi:alpha/beta superfamily hydrolase